MVEKPTPPDAIPKYIHEGMAKQDNRTLRQIIQYAEALIEYHDSQEIEASDSEEIVDKEETSEGTVVIKKVPCGKDNCSSCPHGPYKYLAKRQGDKVTWDYQGPAES